MSSSLPSGLAGSIEEFQATIKRNRDHSDEIEGSSNSIFDTEAGELNRKFGSLLEELEALSSQVQTATDTMESIIRRWRSDGGYL